MLSFMLIVVVALIVFTQFASNYFVDLGILKQSAVTLMVIGKMDNTIGFFIRWIIGIISVRSFKKHIGV